MLSPKIEEFAQKLIKSVRDESIESCDRIAKPSSKNLISKRWQKAKIGSSLEVTTPDTVDQTLFYLLSAIDQGILNLTYTADDGEKVDLTKEGLGELGGWYLGDEGLRDQYSDQRKFPYI